MHKLKSCVLFLCLLWLNSSLAQVDYNKIGEITSTYLIKNVQIYQFEKGFLNASILIKDGQIAQIGANINAPFDAQIIIADSLFAYPSFIDGLSHVGILTKETEKKKEEKVKFPGIPGDKKAGITPNVSIDYNHRDNALEEFRKNGFAVSHISPKGSMLPGKGSVCLLTKDPDVNPYLLHNSSQFSQLKGASGVYPATIIGVLAKWKDLYRKAKYKQDHLQYYEKSNQGKRPNFSSSENEMLDIINKKSPVFFAAEKHKDIARIIKLKEELGFNLVLADVKQGWMSIDKINKMGIPVLLSLDLPEEKKDTKKDTTKISGEQKNLRQKRDASLKEYYAQAATFEKAQIAFGFSTRSTKAKEVHATLMKMKENGASEIGLLKAMTTNSAKILGVSNKLGTIEKGKIANLFLCTKPYFDEKSKIQYTFVEGIKSSYKTDAKKKSDSSASGDKSIVIGKWSYEVDVMGDIQEGTIEIKTDDSNITSITLIDNEDPTDEINAYEITINGSNTIFYFDVEMGPGQMMKIESDINFEAEAFSGQVSVGEFGSFPIKGSLISKPE